MPKDVAFLHSFQATDSTPIKDKLRYVRLMAGLTQKELAAIVSIDRITLSRLESGDVAEENMKTNLLVHIALACGFDKTFCCNRYHTFLALDAGKKFKDFRREHCYTQKSLAEKLGVTVTTVKRWEKNINKPPVNIISAIFPDLFANDN
jgi:DNA-binding XRE family transcriptional regulator